MMFTICTGIEKPPRSIIANLTENTTSVVLVSRTSWFYDRRDVHMRDIVEELPCRVYHWMRRLDGRRVGPQRYRRERCSRADGASSCYRNARVCGKPTHEDWLQFLDEEILAPLPEDERRLLATLAVAEKPIQWMVLAESLEWDGIPPQRLLDYGLLIDWIKVCGCAGSSRATRERSGLSGNQRRNRSVNENRLLSYGCRP